MVRQKNVKNPIEHESNKETFRLRETKCTVIISIRKKQVKYLGNMRKEG